MTGFLIVLIICILIIVFGVKTLKQQKENLAKSGFNKDNVIENVKYKCGHPQLDSEALVSLGLKNKNVYLLFIGNYKEKASIIGSSIKNVIVEDETTFSKKVTLTRLALVGIFAFAMKKKKKEELAYLTIEYNDGRFDHSVVFEYEGKGSISKANTHRNKIISNI
jgi:hypothetical protein